MVRLSVAFFVSTKANRQEKRLPTPVRFVTISLSPHSNMELTGEGHQRTLPLDRNRELLKTAREEIYKTVGDTHLPVYIWELPEKTPPYPKSVAAFFFQQRLGQRTGGAVCSALCLSRFTRDDDDGL